MPKKAVNPADRQLALPSERSGNAVGNRNLKDCGIAALPLESPSLQAGEDVNSGGFHVPNALAYDRGRKRIFADQ